MLRQYRRLSSLSSSLGSQLRCFADQSATTPGEIALAAGVPTTVINRKAVIYAPTRSAEQQGASKSIDGRNPAWKIEFDTQQKWENPLIGWTSTADPLESVSRSALAFGTKEDAIAFCHKHGWAYELKQPNLKGRDRPKRFAGYGDNFSVKRKGIPSEDYLPWKAPKAA